MLVRLRDSWEKTTIGAICDVVRGSSPRPIADQKYFVGGTIPWIKIADATKSGKYLYETREKVNEFGASFSRLLPKGSLIVAASGTLGYTQLLGVPGCIHDGWLHLSNFKGADKDFLYYWLQCQSQRFSNAAYGAAIQNINTMIMKETEIFLPSLQTQRRIASILSAYDDLIENNTRRIAILEEMARRIYEEWFVRFRFPGHEQVKMVESELGLIPEGWKVTNLDAVSEYINRGLTPKYDDLADGVVINQKCIRGQKLSYELVRRQSKPVPADKRVRYGDVLVNSTGVGTLGRVAQVLAERPNCTVDTHVTIVRPGKQVTTHFYGLALLAREEYFEQQGVGATGQTELGRGRIAETTFLLPPLVVQEQFDELVAPMRQMTVTLTSKNANLRATRDLLLPKLISGEIGLTQGDELGPLLTVTVGRELSPSEIERLATALEKSFSLFTLEERVSAPGGNYIGFLTKEEIRENIQLVVECLRKEAGITVLALTPLLTDVSLNVVSNLIANLLTPDTKSSNTVQVANPRVSEGKIQYRSDGKSICGQLNSHHLKDVLESLNGSDAAIECNGSGYTIRLGRAP